MKTLVFTSKFGGLASALLAFSLSGLSAEASTSVPATSNATPTNSACSESHLVPTMAMKPQFPNGKGPMVAVAVGTKRVCQMCPVSSKVVTKAWPNHKGPAQTVETTTVGSIHDCSTGCRLAANN